MRRHLLVHGTHDDAIASDSSSRSWRSTFDRLDRELAHDVVLHVGHGDSIGRSALVAQRRYIDTFVEAVADCADYDIDKCRVQVVNRMRPLVSDERLLFLMELSIEPVRDVLAAR